MMLNLADAGGCQGGTPNGKGKSETLRLGL